VNEGVAHLAPVQEFLAVQAVEGGLDGVHRDAAGHADLGMHALHVALVDAPDAFEAGDFKIAQVQDRKFHHAASLAPAPRRSIAFPRRFRRAPPVCYERPMFSSVKSWAKAPSLKAAAYLLAVLAAWPAVAQDTNPEAATGKSGL